MNQAFKSVSMRFVRAFISGAAASMLVVMPFSGGSWKEVSLWISTLSISAIVGGVTGVIMALDKLYRMN